MQMIRVTDRWNKGKTWVFKIYRDRHVYVNQEIKGRTFYSAFRRSSMKLYREKLRETGIGFVDLGI